MESNWRKNKVEDRTTNYNRYIIKMRGTLYVLKTTMYTWYTIKLMIDCKSVFDGEFS
jgi:hypothetical protein